MPNYISHQSRTIMLTVNNHVLLVMNDNAESLYHNTSHVQMLIKVLYPRCSDSK